jgi:hypothetical protein
MMSSVIHARLEYQCGHAALVSLPRIKGETAAQRNERVAREKSAARARQCDFCAPVVEVIQAVVPEPPPVSIEVPLASAVKEAVSAAIDGHHADRAEPVQLAGPEAVPVPEAVTIPVAESTPATPASSPRLKLQRVARARTPQAATDRRHFLIEYRVERVIQAVDVRDALRQLASLGATDVLEIARED